MSTEHIWRKGCKNSSKHIKHGTMLLHCELLDHFDSLIVLTGVICSLQDFSTGEGLVSWQCKGNYKDSEDDDTQYVTWDKTARKNRHRDGKIEIAQYG